MCVCVCVWWWARSGLVLCGVANGSSPVGPSCKVRVELLTHNRAYVTHTHTPRRNSGPCYWLWPIQVHLETGLPSGPWLGGHDVPHGENPGKGCQVKLVIAWCCMREPVLCISLFVMGIEIFLTKQYRPGSQWFLKLTVQANKRVCIHFRCYHSYRSRSYGNRTLLLTWEFLQPFITKVIS